VQFVGYLYIMDQFNAQKMEHIKMFFQDLFLSNIRVFKGRK